MLFELLISGFSTMHDEQPLPAAWVTGQAFVVGVRLEEAAGAGVRRGCRVAEKFGAPSTHTVVLLGACWDGGAVAGAHLFRLLGLCIPCGGRKGGINGVDYNR